LLRQNVDNAFPSNHIFSGVPRFVSCMFLIFMWSIKIQMFMTFFLNHETLRCRKWGAK
jgi:hypothetical protein